MPRRIGCSFTVLLAAIAAGCGESTPLSSAGRGTVGPSNSSQSTVVAVLRLAPDSLTVEPRVVFPLTALMFNEFGQPVVGRRPSFSSADPSIAAVDSAGAVTGGRIGSTTISAEIDGRMARAAVSVLLTFRSVASGHEHVCGLTVAGVAYCWGSNDAGQLGAGITDAARAVPVAVAGNHDFAAIGPGWSHTCAVTVDGRAWCWGSNAFGKLGDGTAVARAVPTAVAGDLRFVQASAGVSHSCALAADGAAHCWGANPDGRLGDGSTESRSSPVPVAGGLRFVEIGAGNTHSCGLTGSGETWCWGGNSHGQLGRTLFRTRSLVPVLVQGAPEFRAISVADHDFTCGVTLDEVLYCWGHNDFAQLGRGTRTPDEPDVLPVDDPVGYRAVGSDGGGFTACALRTGGVVYCWAGYGQSAAWPFGVVPGRVPGFVGFSSVTSGDVHGCGLGLDRAVYCWGLNWGGVLGDGTGVDSPTPVKVAFQR